MIKSVSLPLFLCASKILEDQYGPKLCGTDLEAFREKLAEAEEIFKSLPNAPNKERRRKKKANQ